MCIAFINLPNVNVAGSKCSYGSLKDTSEPRKWLLPEEAFSTLRPLKDCNYAMQGELTQNKSCHVNRKMKINGRERWIHVKMDMKVSRHREAISLPVVASPWSIKERRRVLGKSLSGGPCTSVTTRTKRSNSSLPVTS